MKGEKNDAQERCLSALNAVTFNGCRVTIGEHVFGNLKKAKYKVNCAKSRGASATYSPILRVFQTCHYGACSKSLPSNRKVCH